MSADTSAEIDLEQVGQRVEQLLEEVAAAQPAAAEAAEQLVRELLGMYGAGLARMLTVVEEAAPAALGRLADDPLVAGLLALHDLHPVDLTTRVERALDDVRPYLGSHGGDVELVGIDDDVVRLRLVGSCNGCGASEITLKNAVEGAIHEAAPEISELNVEGAVQQGSSSSGLIPASSLSLRPGSEPSSSWTVLDAVELPRDTLTGRDVDGQRIVLTRVGQDLYAYRDACPACGASLDGAEVDAGTTACPGCSKRYNVRIAGRLVDAEGPAMEPVPLVEEGDEVRVALGVPS